MSKTLRRFAIAATAMAAMTAASFNTASAADIPCSTAKLIVPWGAGGGTDVIFRIVADAANKAGAEPQIQVVNISGQGGNKGAKEAVKAKPDGCTLFAIHQSAITSYFTGRVDFSVEAFDTVALLTRTPAIIGANAAVPYNNVTELVAAAKANPGTILAGGTLGSTSHFVFLLLEDKAGVKFKHISYDGTRQRMTALLAKNIEIGEINLAAAKKYIQTNELKALGITTPERNADIPDVMTMREQGIDMIYGTDRGIVMPKGTPKDVVAHYEGILAKAMKDPSVVEALAKKGTQVVFLPSAEYRRYFDETFTDWKRIAKEVGVYKRND
jgi:tripartite-type tricarboxylate transporter receptor subunit TctC